MKLFEVDLVRSNSRDRPIERLESVSQVVERISNDCQEIMTLYKSLNARLRRDADLRVLYRGEMVHTELAFYNTINQQRMPTDLPAEAQHYADEELQRHGAKALRRNSIFCSGSLADARNFGRRQYVIFPKDGFEFTWLANLSDAHAYSRLMDWWDAIKSDRMRRHRTSNKIKPNAKELQELSALIDEWKPRTDDLTSAIRNRTEIMITGAGYYAVAVQQLLKSISNDDQLACLIF